MPNKPIKLILVDDQKLFRDGLISLISEYSHVSVIAEASNGKELIELLKTSITPDVILLDIEMPIIDGSTTLDILRKNYKEIPVIILSQYPEEELIENFLSRGARAYLNKNTNIEVIVETINRVVNTPSNIKFNRSHIGVFTPREEEIIPLLCNAKTTKQIAHSLNIDIKTVEAHRSRLFLKTKTSSIQEFIKTAISKGLHYLKRPK